MTLTLVDGGAGDNDGAANGTIVDPGAPAVPASTAPVIPEDKGLFGVGALGHWLLFPLLAAAALRRRRFMARAA